MKGNLLVSKGDPVISIVNVLISKEIHWNSKGIPMNSLGNLLISKEKPWTIKGNLLISKGNVLRSIVNPLIKRNHLIAEGNLVEINRFPLELKDSLWKLTPGSD